MRDELVKLGLPHEILKVEQEVETLFVRNARESVVRVFALQVSDQLGELMVMAVVFNGIPQGFPPYDGGEVAVLLSVSIRLIF